MDGDLVLGETIANVGFDRCVVGQVRWVEDRLRWVRQYAMYHFGFRSIVRDWFIWVCRVGKSRNSL